MAKKTYFEINLENITKNKTAVKAGITGAVTLGTYLGIGAFEDMATNNFLNQSLDFAQSVATMAVPYLMAEYKMNKENDTPWIKYATQVIPMLFLPEAASKLDFVMPSTYPSVINDYSTHLRAIGAAFPFIGWVRDALDK